MKKDLGVAGELFPQSVFIVASYDEDGVPNAMNVAWAGECTRHEVAINIGDHKTKISWPRARSPWLQLMRPTSWKPTTSAWPRGAK